MKAQVLIVDDHPVVRNGLRADLERDPHIVVLGEASSGETALAMAGQLKPDLILMDIHLGQDSGIEITRRILAEHPFIKVIIFSGDSTSDAVDDALQAGVLGYILKASPFEELYRAIQMAMEGRLYLCPEVAAPVFHGYKKLLASQSKPTLTERETDVLRLIAEGLQNKEIAGKLGVSAKAIEKTRSRVMTKLGYHSVAELARYAAREGLVSK
jgi:DNA-binding NarL/FixJ family response regulator